MNSKVISLITFKVGDLFRCKCSSKQKEINALYNQLHRISEKNPEIIKIVKIKNRLQAGTKDVLLNLLFQKKILIEVQLAIDTGKNTFMECSDKFNHFIYEVQRAEFGPISELCSIWMNKDLRANFFKKRFQEVYRPNFPLHLFSAKERKEITFPFLCPKCSRYGINPLNISNFDEQCMHCIFEKKEYQEYNKIRQINEAFKNLPDILGQEKVERIKYEVNQSVQFPKQGLIINLKRKEKQSEFFKCFQRGKKKYLITKKQQNQFSEIGEVTDKWQQQNFLQNNLVFCHQQFQQKANKIKEQEITKLYFIPKTFQKIKEEQKASIRIMGEGLTNDQIRGESFYFVQSINLSENQLTDLNKITNKFPKAQKLILNNNKFSRIQIQQNMVNLRQLNLNTAGIKEIVKTSFQNLKGVEILLVKRNHISKLPHQFKEMANLKILDLSLNQLYQMKYIQTIVLDQIFLKFCNRNKLKIIVIFLSIYSSRLYFL